MTETLTFPTTAGSLSTVSNERTSAADELSAAVAFPLVSFDVASGKISSDGEVPAWLPADCLASLRNVTAACRVSTNAVVDIVATPIPGAVGQLAVAVVPFPDCEPPTSAVVDAADGGWTNDAFLRWWRTPSERAANDLVRGLSAASNKIQSAKTQDRLEWELETMAEQIDSTYEEISLLHFLAQNLHVSQATDELASLCLSRMRESLACGGTVAWLELDGGESEFLVDGDVQFDELGLAMLLSNYDRHRWPQPLVLNHCGDGHRAIGVENMVVVPVSSADRRVGWVACINACGGREFGTVEASLVASVAVSLGTHLRNASVVHEQESMLLSFVRSLVSSLDAKDPYTRGHSERVAAIARRLAEQLGFPDEEVEAIHLSGLLHDVGKIGVSDHILSKPERLTDDEFEQIQQHPTIGYQILSNITRLQHVLPGVRSHHESMDGSGYPDGLAGEEIPMMARVLAVADSYDAMGSDRPYRAGMPLPKLEAILRGGAGTQWDETIIDAYFECRNDIRRICVDWAARQTG